MERRLLFALPAGVLITGAIFVGLDFALRLPEPVADQQIQASRSPLSRTIRTEPVQQDEVSEPPPLKIEAELVGGVPPRNLLLEALPTEPAVDIWSSNECRAYTNGDDAYAILDFVVDGSGRTKDVEVVEASSPDLAECIASASRHWQWQPSTVDGKPVEREGIRRRIRFTD